MRRYFWQSIINLILALLPLLSATGRNLEYEYTLILSILLLAIWPFIALINQSRMQEQIMRRGHSGSALEIWWIWLIGPFFLLVPGALLFLTNTCLCSSNGFLLWMLIQTYPAWIISQAFYHLMWRGRLHGKQRLVLATGYGFLVSCACLRISTILWVNPQKRIVDLFAGFLHGPIYDSFIAVDHGILLARLSHLWIGVILLIVAWFKSDRLRYGALCLSLLFWILSASFAGQYPTLTNSQQSLQRQLPEVLTDGLISLHYSKASGKSAPEILKQAKFHFEEINSLFETDSKAIAIYLYPDETTKKLLFGGGSTDVADVYTPSIHITDRGGWHPTLRHELVHAIAASFAYYGLGFHPNMAFTEGLAVALSPRKRPLSLKDQAASLFGTNRLPNMNHLFSPMFWAQPGKQSYTVAGSVIEYIIDTSGIQAVRNLYSGRSWQKSLNKSKKQTLLAWKAFTLSGVNPDLLALYSESMFRRPGTLHDRCPHSKADLAKDRSGSVYNRLRQPFNWDMKEDYWPWRVQLEADNGHARYRWWKAQIKHYAERLPLPIGRLRTWEATLGKARHWPPKAVEDVELAILQSDLLMLLNNRQQSFDILSSLQRQLNTQYFGDQIHRQIMARILLSQLPDAAQASIWQRYLAGWELHPPRNIRLQNPWIMSYLQILHAARKSYPRQLEKDWITLKIPAGLPVTFSEEWYEALGDIYIHQQDLPQAEEAFKKALISCSQTNRPYFDMRLRYVRQMQQAS